MRINRGVGAIALLGSGLLVAAAAVLLLPASRGIAAPSTQHITVGDNFYNPTTISVNAGDTVQWDWPAPPSGVSHTVTSDGPDTTLDSGAPKSTGTFSHTFGAAGIFRFHCEVHPGQMTGTITVLAAAAPTNTAPAASNTPPTTSASATSTASPTRTVTGTITPIATNTPSATSIVTPTITSGLAPTAVAGRPSVTPAAAAAAAARLPRTGTGRAESRWGRFGWLSLVLAASGVGTLGFVPIAVRRR